MVAAVMALLGGIKKFAGGGLLVSGPGSATGFDPGASVRRRIRGAGGRRAPSRRGLPSTRSTACRQAHVFKGGELAFAAGGLVPEVKVPPAQPQMNQAVRIVNAVDPGVTHDHLQSPAGEKVIVNIIGRNARAIRGAAMLVFRGNSMALLFIDGFDHYDPQAAGRLRRSVARAARQRICRRRPPASGPSSVLPCPAPAGRFGRRLRQEPDATKTSLIVGRPSRGAVPEHLHRAACCWACAMPTAQVAHLVKIGEDGRLKLYRWQYGYDQLISVSVASAPARAGTTSSCRSRKAPATAFCQCASTVLAIQMTAQNTIQAAANCSRHSSARCPARTVRSTDVDDFYIADTSGTINNTGLGDVRVDALQAQADGSLNQWTVSPRHCRVGSRQRRGRSRQSVRRTPVAPVLRCRAAAGDGPRLPSSACN